MESAMAPPAERMRTMRERRRAQGLRELRLIVADARSKAVRRRIARQVARLNPESERDALAWIEAVSEFDADAPRGRRHGGGRRGLRQAKTGRRRSARCAPRKSCSGGDLPDDLRGARCPSPSRHP